MLPRGPTRGAFGFKRAPRAPSTSEMQRGNDARVFLLQTIELGYGVAGSGYPDLHSLGAQRLARLLRDLHPAVVAGTDDEHWWRVGENGLQILGNQIVPVPTPPSLLHVVGKDDDVGIVALAADSDPAEGVVVNVHGAKIIVAARNGQLPRGTLPYG